MIVCEEIKKKERRKKEKRNEVSASVFFRLRYCKLLKTESSDNAVLAF